MKFRPIEKIKKLRFNLSLSVVKALLFSA